MRLIALLLGVAACAFTFGAWGLGTAAGRRAFDEMDGLYPFFALVLAGLLLVMVIVLVLVRFARRRRAGPRPK